jgi:putative mRNA 3-end processing factor
VSRPSASPSSRSLVQSQPSTEFLDRRPQALIQLAGMPDAGGPSSYICRMANPSSWLRVTAAGLYCEPGAFHIDPTQSVERAIVTHGHSDHARAGHRHLLATPETLAIMRLRYGEGMAGSVQSLGYGETVAIDEVSLRLVPAGHILGSAQAVIEHKGQRMVVSGDYKRRPDPTCAPFESVSCDLFVTEATFGLPVFRHPPDSHEIEKLLHSLRLFPDRAHLVGVYALGKCQRLLALLREAGYDEPVYLHGALVGLCELYRTHGVALGPVLAWSESRPEEFKGKIVLAPPAALADRWTRRLPDPLTALASGWMRVKQRAKARGVELPLVISDHADWAELTRTLDDVGAGEIWVTHGREEALVHYAGARGLAARALALTGFGEEEGE